MRLLWGVAVLAACGGDPRLEFIGSYVGTGAWTYTESGRVNSGMISFTITAPDRSDRVLFSGECGWTGQVVDLGKLQMDPIVCPPERSTSVSGVAATYTNSYTGGAAGLQGKTITITQSGTQLASNFADGRPNAMLPFREVVMATKQ